MNKSGTLQTKSVTASQLATDSPTKVNGHSNQGRRYTLPESSFIYLYSLFSLVGQTLVSFSSASNYF